MRRLRVLGAAAALAAACALPKVELDPALADGGASAGKGGSGGGGSGGSAGKGSSGSAGTAQLGGGAGAGADEERETKCGEYCASYLDNCGDFEANTYDDETDCLTTCFTSNWPLGDDLAQVNSLQCRLLHSQLAATAQVPHCFHSAEFPSMGSCTP